MNNFTYRNATFCYILLFITLIWPIWINGEVLSPHRQLSELALTDQTSSFDKQIENRKFSDFTSCYIPDIAQYLNGTRSGWLKLWTNKNELGRPLLQILGFSPAYMPSWLLAQISENPLRFITSLSILTCFFTGLFIILYCSEMGLVPLAGLVAGTSIAASPVVMYWLTFPMFNAAWCWSAGALWAVTRLAKKPSLLAWITLTFSSYSLLMTAYPQLVIYHAWLLGGYGIYLAWHKAHVDHVGGVVYFFACTASALVIGGALTLPVYLDLIFQTAESARVAPDPSFFTAILPKIANFTELVRFLVLSTLPEFFGNPIAPSYPFPYNGMSTTLVMIFFAVISILSTFKKTWGWWLAIFLLCLLTFVHPFYLLAVKYLGLNISRSSPICIMMLPLTVIIAFGVDALATFTDPKKRFIVTIIAVGCGLTAIIVCLSFGLLKGIPIRWEMVAAMLLVIGLLAAQSHKFQPLLIVCVLGILLVKVSYPLILHRDPTGIAITSPLVDKIRSNLPEGTRFTVVGPPLAVLPPNLNAGLGLASLHSYNSLSSRRYHSLIKALGGQMNTYGRINVTVSPNYSGPIFWMSNISLILSATKLIGTNIEYLGMESDVHLYKVLSRMGDSLQITPQMEDTPSEAFMIKDPRSLPNHSPTKLVDEGDILEFEVTNGPPSVLILSQKFHRDWKAVALTSKGWQPTNTMEINSIFQGVSLPIATERIRLEFKPYSRYAWIAHVFWFLLLILLGFSTLRTRIQRHFKES